MLSITVKPLDIAQNDSCEVKIVPRHISNYCVLFRAYDILKLELSTKKWKKEDLSWRVSKNDKKLQEWYSFGVNKKELKKKVK